MMRGIQYIRVSDEEQAIEGYSIPAQKALLDRKFTEWGATVAAVYIDDGYSAKDLRRPDLQRLISEIATIQPDFIAFWKLDRWTRGGSRDWHILQDYLKPLGITLKSAIGENLSEDTAFDRFNVGLNVLLGQFEREQISERVYFVMMERHLKGLRNGGKAPIGYDLAEGKLIINADFSEDIIEMHEWYDKDLMGFRAIALKLNKKPGRNWSYNSVRYALLNPVYCSKLRWNYRKLNGKPTGKEVIVDSDHPPIVSVEQKARVIEKIISRKSGGKAATSEYAFSGVLKCARCGKAMTGFNRRGAFYRCTGRANAGTCNMPVISGKRLEQTFVSALVYDSTQVRKLVDVPDDNGKMEQERVRLQNELESVKKRKKKWQMAYVDEAITLDDLRERTREDGEREKTILQELDAFSQVPKNEISRREIAEKLSRVGDVFAAADNRSKKGFIHELFQEISVDAERGDWKPAPGRFATPVIKDFVIRQSKSYL